MPKTNFKPGNMLYPVPAVLVSCGDINGFSNIITIAWTGTICTNPPMLYISVRPERFSYDIIKKSGEFIINLTMIKEAPVNIECHVTEIKELGSHHMFIADVTAVHAGTEYIDKNNKFHLDWPGLISYSHGSYYALGKQAGTFGFSVKKDTKTEHRKK